MKSIFREPLVLISILLGALGGLQASWGHLSPLVEKHPTAFGLAMVAISTLTAALAAAKAAVSQKPAP